MLVYATLADLDAFVTPTPDNADQLLRTASLRVREATKSACYDVDADDLPTDPDVAEAFKDATCVHAAALAAAKVDPATGGILTKTTTATSKSVGSASVTYAGAAEAAASLARLNTTLAPDAAAILSQAGLTGTTAWVVG